MKKLQNCFNVFLPQNYFHFRRKVESLPANEAVVAELLRICCEKDDVKAIKVAFERILGKPEKVIIIKRTLVRIDFPDARAKAQKAIVNNRVMDEVQIAPTADDRIVISESNAPGILLRKMIDEIGDKPQSYTYDVLERKEQHTVAEVMAANLYGIAMRGANIAAIELLFDYLDGAVADVIRLEGEDTILLENWADTAPFEAKQDEAGVWYVETEGVR